MRLLFHQVLALLYLVVEKFVDVVLTFALTILFELHLPKGVAHPTWPWRDVSAPSSRGCASPLSTEKYFLLQFLCSST